MIAWTWADWQGASSWQTASSSAGPTLASPDALLRRNDDNNSDNNNINNNNNDDN